MKSRHNYDHQCPSRGKKVPVIIKKELCDNVLLEDMQGLQASISKEICSINNLEARDGKLYLSDSIYQHYFKKELKHRKVLIRKAFSENLHTILKNRELILAHPEYFLLRTADIGASAAYLGDSKLCLGGLFEAWNSSTILKVDDQHGNDAFITRISGSPLSGSNSYTAWIPATGKFICGRFEKKWLLRYSEFRRIAKKYPFPLRDNTESIEKLLRELKCII